jgi:hypothetical protein
LDHSLISQGNAERPTVSGMSSTDPEVPAAIESVLAGGYKSATGDNGSATKFDVDEVIKADRYAASKKRQGFGIRMTKIVPGGAV